MPSTIPLSRSIGVTQNFVRNAPLTFSGTNEPALSNADWVRQFILAAPFAWNWNRSKVTFVAVIGQQDYVLEVANFGWLEKGVVADPTSGNETHELEIETDLPEEGVPNLPTRVSAQMDDDAGNITFRLMPPPDKGYQVTLTLQNGAALFADPDEFWSPIPDRLSYLYNQGMLAKAYEYLDDARFGISMQLFLRQVIAANAGLDDTQVDIFLRDRVNSENTLQTRTQTSQQGRAGRGMN